MCSGVAVPLAFASRSAPLHSRGRTHAAHARLQTKCSGVCVVVAPRAVAAEVPLAPTPTPTNKPTHASYPALLTACSGVIPLLIAAH
ncbi:hypothetical protein EON67_07145 [archaeon]|nr:MAG: hypothetical protein EON67_07145 [archaeon]